MIRRSWMVAAAWMITALAGVTMGQSASAVDLTISSANVSVGGTATLAVSVTNPGGTAVGLAAFSIQLQVTPTSPRRMEFDTTTQPNTLGNSQYVFFGDSAAQTGSITPWTISNGAGVNAEYTFTDTTESTNEIVLGANETRILAFVRLISGSGAAAPILGDQFQVSFVTAGTSLSAANLSLVPFTEGAGTITVVPEPGTYVLGGLSGAMALGAAARRNKRSKTFGSSKV